MKGHDGELTKFYMALYKARRQLNWIGGGGGGEEYSYRSRVKSWGTFIRYIPASISRKVLAKIVLCD